MKKGKRIKSVPNIAFLSTLSTLAITIIFSYFAIKIRIPQYVPSLSPVPSFSIILILMLFDFRGLFLRVKYAVYLSIATLILLFIQIFAFNLFLFPIYYPLIITSIVTMVLMIIYRKDYNFPTRFFDKPEISISIIVILIVMAYGVLGTLILGTQFHPAIKNIVSAIYYTGEVVTTLGFGDIIPLTEISRLFTVSLAILGLGTFFGSTAVIIAPMIYSRGKRVVSFLEKIESERLENYVIIIGYSHLLKPLVKYLLSRDELVIIASDTPDIESELEEAGVFIEYESDMDILIKRFNLRRSRMILLGSSDDGVNILNAISIKNMYGKEIENKIVAIVNESGNYGKVKSIISETLDPSLLLVEHFKKYL